MKNFIKALVFAVLLFEAAASLLAQYEEGSLGTTGNNSVENTIKAGTLIVVGKFYDNTERGFAGSGTTLFTARVQVSRILLGNCDSSLKAQYKVLPRSVKGEDGIYKQIAGRHESPQEGTELIAVGTKYEDDGEFHQRNVFYVQRYLYATPENIERVKRLIVAYHGPKNHESLPSMPNMDGTPSNLAPPAHNSNAALEAAPSTATAKKTSLDEPTAVMPWSIIVMLLVAAGCLLAWLLKRRK